MLIYCCNTWILHVCELPLLTPNDTPDYDVQGCYIRSAWKLSTGCLENIVGAQLQP